MIKTLVVGNSLSLIPIVEKKIAQDKDRQIAIFSTEAIVPYDRFLLPSYLAGRLTEKQVLSSSEHFLSTYHPELITDESLARISVKRKHLTTSKKNHISYDELILVDTGRLILPSVKGHQRLGVFDAWQLSTIKSLKKHLTFTDTAVVVATNIQGINVACAIKQLNKEVIVVSKAPGLLPDIFDDETGLLLKQILEERGIRVVGLNAIEEILGDQDVKAIKLASGKVLACETVIFDEAKIDLRMLSEPVLNEEDLLVNEPIFNTPIMPLLPVHFGLDIFDGFFIGWTKLPEGGREYLTFDGPQNVYKKILCLEDHLVGAITFNAPTYQETLTGLIERQDNIAGREEELIK